MAATLTLKSERLSSENKVVHTSHLTLGPHNTCHLAGSPSHSGALEICLEAEEHLLKLLYSLLVGINGINRRSHNDHVGAAETWPQGTVDPLE